MTNNVTFCLGLGVKRCAYKYVSFVSLSVFIITDEELSISLKVLSLDELFYKQAQVNMQLVLRKVVTEQ